MEDKELIKKDFQILTSRSIINILAYQRTIMENQAFIISKIANIPLDEVVAKTHEYYKDNIKRVNEMIDKDISTYEEVEKIRY